MENEMIEWKREKRWNKRKKNETKEKKMKQKRRINIIKHHTWSYEVCLLWEKITKNEFVLRMNEHPRETTNKTTEYKGKNRKTNKKYIILN